MKWTRVGFVRSLSARAKWFVLRFVLATLSLCRAVFPSSADVLLVDRDWLLGSTRKCRMKVIHRLAAEC